MDGKEDMCTYCGLPRPALSNQGNRLTGLDYETHVSQDFLHMMMRE